MKNWVSSIAIGTILLTLAGCASTSNVAGSSGDGDGFEYAGTRDGTAESFALPNGQGGINGSGGGVGIGPSPEAVSRTVYFDYDSAAIRETSRPVIEAHGRYLVDNPAVSVLLEGHTDERGTREYNIALGDQRGVSVRQLMLALGVSPQQINVISYGEERAADSGAGEASYAKNRRVEIAY